MDLSDIQWAALSSKGEVRSSYDLAARCIREGVPGDFVECGVFAGVQCAAMAKAIMDAEMRQALPQFRQVHLFDSFEGLPELGPRDVTLKKGGNKKGGACCSLAQVKDYMRTWGIPDELLVYHPGWFADTMPGLRWRDSSVALLRLDGDLYESTLLGLRTFYPLLSPGGFCIVDDYGLDGCRQAVEEYMGNGFPPIYWQRQGGQ